MGFRFRRGIRNGPARVNIGKRGVTSVSFGRGALRTNLSRRGVSHSVGVPGSGMSYSTRPRGCCLSNTLIGLAVMLISLRGVAGIARRQLGRTLRGG